MKAQRSWFLAALLALLVCSACSTTLGCELLGSSKVAQGQRYQSEDQRYDPYFEGVYQQQVAAAAWYDDKKAARRSLVGVLALTPSASDDTVIAATRERAKKLGGGGAKLDLASAHVSAAGGAGDPQLFAAVEELVRLELERARKLRAASEKLEEMSRQGEDHKRTADREFENRGAEKADDKKTDKRTEIRRELGGAIDATRSLAKDASRLAREAQLFLEDLGSALEAKDTPARGRGARGEPKAALPPPPPAKADEPKKADEPRKADEPKKADEPRKADDARGKPGKPSEAGRKPRPSAPPTDKPADKPPADKPAGKPADDFTP